MRGDMPGAIKTEKNERNERHMQTNETTPMKGEQGVNLADVFLYLASKWKWFLLSVAVLGGLSWYHWAKSPLVYYRSATVIIKDPSSKTSTAGLDRFDNFINKVNVANEILQFRSKRLMREVVTRLHADVSYTVQDGLRRTELYTSSPVAVRFPDASPEQSLGLTVTAKDKGHVQLGGFQGFGPSAEGRSLTVRLGDTVSVSPGLRVVVTATNDYGTGWQGRPVEVRKSPLDAVADRYRNSIGIQQEEEESSILTLSVKDNSAARAEDVLNMLITVYNEEAIKDKNQVAVNTADFINERLIIISRELGGVETELEDFKRTNLVVDLGATTGYTMGDAQKYGTEALELETQLRLAGYIKEYLTDPSKETGLIPSNTGISDMNIENQITLYNTAKLKRDRLLGESSENNPVVLELNNSLRSMKQSIIRAVDNLIVSLDVKRQDATARERRAQGRVLSIPRKEREMLSIERQQKIKESLYLYLLNKREENALSQAMADNNARVIDSADGPSGPVAPNRNRMLALGVLSGLFLPGVVFLCILFMDTRVRSRKEIEGALTVPFLGTIPYDRKRKGADLTEGEADGGSAVSEAFRVLRTNMSFMSRKGSSQQVVTFTSFNEGAGKTFVARNLALSLTYAKKRVVLLDLDIRKGTLSRHFGAGHVGVTNYLADPSLTVDDVIQHLEAFDIVPAGAVAPNPAELLMDERLDSLVSELRSRYDYVVADNVPVGLIADASIANRIADLTLFVVRAGRLDRRQLPDIERLYADHKLRNMAVVLNGVDHHGNGYGYGYGRYGYGYGYGYGKKHKHSRRK
mgnify:CR=1 FL=1